MTRNFALRAGLAWLALASLLCACATPRRTSATGQNPGRFTASIRQDLAADYLLFLPRGYDPSSAKRWPLLIFLHGAGERGSDVSRVAVHGPPKIAPASPDFPFVVLSPQCPEGATWNLALLDALLDDTLARHSIDPKRVYLTGLSMGGYGTWAWASARPERFAAIVPICGGGEWIHVSLAGGARREQLSKLPIWCFHGAKDNVVPLSESQRMLDAFKGLGNEGRLTVYPEAGHDSWTETYANPELYRWLTSHARP